MTAKPRPCISSSSIAARRTASVGSGKSALVISRKSSDLALAWAIAAPTSATSASLRISVHTAGSTISPARHSQAVSRTCGVIITLLLRRHRYWRALRAAQEPPGQRLGRRSVALGDLAVDQGRDVAAGALGQSPAAARQVIGHLWRVQGQAIVVDDIE